MNILHMLNNNRMLKTIENNEIFMEIINIIVGLQNLLEEMEGKIELPLRKLEEKR